MRHIAVREDIRDTILDAADRLIERYGYKKTTMDDIAREAGIGKGTIYLYFPSKEEVALSCSDRSNHQAQVHLQSIARSYGTPVERLRNMLVMRVMLRFDRVQHFTQSLDDIYAALRSALFARRERCLETEAQIFAEVIAEGQSEGTFAAADPVLTAHTLLLATKALMPFSLSPRELGEREQVHGKASRLADLLLNGLIQRPNPNLVRKETDHG